MCNPGPNQKKGGVKCTRALNNCALTCGACGIIAEYEDQLAECAAANDAKDGILADYEATFAEYEDQLAECGGDDPGDDSYEYIDGSYESYCAICGSQEEGFYCC